MELPLNYQDIIKVLPHRYPFLLVDRITEFELGKRIVGIKNVSINEPFFQGHFPENPVMPGVLMIEAMAQAGGILAFASLPEDMHGMLVYFMAIDKVKFRRPVVPGDQLVLDVTYLKKSSWAVKLACQATVDERKVSEAELTATFGKKVV